MNANAVHTCAKPTAATEGDLFDTPTRILLTGVLRADARVTARPCDHGNAYPVVSVDLDCEGPAHRRITSEQVFPSGMRFQADAYAARLRKGMRVQVCASSVDAHLHLPHAESITVITTQS